MLAAGIDLAVPSGAGAFLFPLFFVAGTYVAMMAARSSASKASDIWAKGSHATNDAAGPHIAVMVTAMIFGTASLFMSLVMAWNIFAAMYLPVAATVVE